MPCFTMFLGRVELPLCTGPYIYLLQNQSIVNLPLIVFVVFPFLVGVLPHPLLPTFFSSLSFEDLLSQHKDQGTSHLPVPHLTVQIFV